MSTPQGEFGGRVGGPPARSPTGAPPGSASASSTTPTATAAVRCTAPRRGPAGAAGARVLARLPL